jgi:dimethylamine/trimethylamine dehydrogenase
VATTEPSKTYLKTLLQYYEEEIEGAAYFDTLAERLNEPDQRKKMVLMADVERYASAAVEPLLEKYDLKPQAKEQLFKSGNNQATASSLNWTAILEGMIKTFPGYIEMFKDLEAMAPAEDRPMLEVLTAHEVAALEFLHLESQLDPSSTLPMMHYLKTGTAETPGDAKEQT